MATRVPKSLFSVQFGFRFRGQPGRNSSLGLSTIALATTLILAVTVVMVIVTSTVTTIVVRLSQFITLHVFFTIRLCAAKLGHVSPPLTRAWAAEALRALALLRVSIFRG